MAGIVARPSALEIRELRHSRCGIPASVEVPERSYRNGHDGERARDCDPRRLSEGRVHGRFRATCTAGPAAPRIAEAIVEAIGVDKTYDTGTACCSRSWGSDWSWASRR